MRIVYLDQNQWIKLARALKKPRHYPELASLAAAVEEAATLGKLYLPLTAANIYETYKINDPGRRTDLATIQCRMSQGRVFVGRHKRLTREIAAVVRAIYGQSEDAVEERWFLSNIFFEAFAAHDDERLPTQIPSTVLTAIGIAPAFALFDFLTNSPEDIRRLAVKQWSDGSVQLGQRIEQRRRMLAKESMSMRRRAYSAHLMIDELEVILRFACAAGADWRAVKDIGAANARRLMREVPAYHTERELAIRIESLTRPVNENDFRDMATFCATLPYADCVVSENLFVNLARQARLDERFQTTITTDLMAVATFL